MALKNTFHPVDPARVLPMPCECWAGRTPSEGTALTTRLGRDSDRSWQLGSVQMTGSPKMHILVDQGFISSHKLHRYNKLSAETQSGEARPTPKSRTDPCEHTPD
ncbi:unnamed protein product [Pleuronectes platessa]|uniref:Uncharacterized protein n=1 Tax=Pleuronectes platessa TaxID=8262 RepID=A0A9N7W0F8_PLEPL|nr:unnamed protein product [Pleuronectes platessa]